MRAVIDTNVLVSRLLSAQGTPATVFQRWEEEQFVLMVSAPILDEYRRVLAYDRLRKLHRLSDEDIQNLVTGIQQVAVFVEVQGILRVVPDDPDDDRFVECAVEGRADVIVSGNDHLLRLKAYQGIQILTPAAFLALLDHENK